MTSVHVQCCHSAWSPQPTTLIACGSCIVHDCRMGNVSTMYVGSNLCLVMTLTYGTCQKLLMRICRIRQDLVLIVTYSSAANWRDDFQDLRGSIMYTHEQMEQYVTVCKNVNVGRRFSSKCRCYCFFCPLGRYIIEDLHVPLPHT